MKYFKPNTRFRLELEAYASEILDYLKSRSDLLGRQPPSASSF